MNNEGRKGYELLSFWALRHILVGSIDKNVGVQTIHHGTQGRSSLYKASRSSSAEQSI
jgi:hypothetical protein